MTDREIAQLYKLITKFYNSKGKDGEDYFKVTERSIVSAVRQWVRWYADDVNGIDLDRK